MVIYTDERGHEHANCHVCGVDCSTHPDAGNSLAACGDCGKATCPEHRDETAATRCTACQAILADDYLGQVLDRMGCRFETLEEAVEAVTGGNREMSARVIAMAQGKR